MLVKLLRNAKVWHKAGEIVEVSPEECHFLVSTDGAEIIEAVKPMIETPEKEDARIEIPEKKKTIMRKK